MNSNTFEPILAVLGLSGGELLLIFLAMLVFVAMVGGLIVLVIWLTRRNHSGNLPPPALSVPPTKRVCPQCGKEMAADAPQGLCPSCLMKVGLGTETANQIRRAHV